MTVVKFVFFLWPT